MLSNAVKRGFRLSCGSWNTICTSRRCGERWKSLAGIAEIDSPRKMMSPPSPSISRQISRDSVLLPEPDSPTSPMGCRRAEG